MNLNDEIICGFNVTKKRKEIWSKQLEMVKLFDNICEENGLRYYLAGGTLLGAIRHNGYIPWDDDIDIMMPRKDYEIFLKIAENYFSNTEYFFQSYKSEKLYFNGHAQIRNINTTCLLKNGYMDLKYEKNCGIFIDIFPYDYYDYKISKKIKFIKSLIFSRINKDYPKGPKGMIKKFICMLKFPTLKSCEKGILKIEILAKSAKKSNNVSLMTFLPLYEGNIWPREFFENFIYHKFENLNLRIPVDYDNVLKQEYGDYMEIPENKNGTIHGSCYFDLEKSYTEYQSLTKEEYEKLFERIDY